MDVIQQIFSKSRAAVFSVLFVRILPQLHLREISRRTGFAVRTVQCELQRLVDCELVIESADGNRKLFRANRDHPIFEEIVRIIEKTVGIEQKLRNVFAGLDEVESAWIFGSYASGRMKPGSDIDVLIVGDLTLRQAAKILKSISETSGHECNPKIYTRDEYERARAESDGFLERILREPKIRLK